MASQFWTCISADARGWTCTANDTPDEHSSQAQAQAWMLPLWHQGASWVGPCNSVTLAFASGAMYLALSLALTIPYQTRYPGLVERDTSAQLACVLCRKALFSALVALLGSGVRRPVLAGTHLGGTRGTGQSTSAQSSRDAVVRGVLGCAGPLLLYWATTRVSRV